jgi:Zn finger protein HypA/HybF involved in hydrogenase expression
MKKVNVRVRFETVMSCANCFTMLKSAGKVTIKCCPNCKSTNKDLTRVRLWVDGQPDYSKNLLDCK